MKPLIIAEIGQAHDGSLGFLHSYIDAVSKYNIDIIKFQTHIAEAESSIHEDFRVNFSYEDKSRYDYWKRMEFSLDQWIEIKKHCDDRNIEFMSSPFSLAAVNLLNKIGVNRFKIGSGEISNYLMINKILETGKEIILSTGLSNHNDLDDLFNFIGHERKDRISILQCTTKYPTKPEDIGLNLMKELKNRYDVKTGLSDHSGKIYPLLAATALEADILEFHVTFDKNQFGPDSSSSIEIRELNQLIEGIEFISIMNENKLKKDNINSIKKNKIIFGKSLCLNKSVKADHLININDLESKKPYGKGISAKDFESIIGKKINKNMNKWDFLNLSDLK